MLVEEILKRHEPEQSNNTEIEKQKSELVVQGRFVAYKAFLVDRGANEELFEMPAIKEIIIDIIEKADKENAIKNKPPVSYKAPHEDGTFDIAGRIHGPKIELIYKMTYSNDDNENHFITLIHEKPSAMPSTKNQKNNFEAVEIIHINKDGDIVERTPISQEDIYINQSNSKGRKR